MRALVLASMSLGLAVAGTAAADDAGPLQGLKPAEVRAQIGTPNVAHAEGEGAFWTYRLKRCALMVFFSTAEGRGLRVVGVEAGARHKGDTPPTADRCVAEAVEEAAP